MQSLATQATSNNNATGTLVKAQAIATQPTQVATVPQQQSNVAVATAQPAYVPSYTTALPPGALPQQYYTAQPPIPTTQQYGAPQQPAASSGVNIIIYNPSVNPTAGTVANSNNSYNMAPQPAYPPNYYLQPQQPLPATAVADAYIASTPIKEQQTPAQPVAAQDLSTAAEKPEPKKQEETHKEEVVQLTDDYVRTLENYLNNDDIKIREMGVKELMARFKEHKSRKNDIALTCLLNKALQDPSGKIRFVALATLDAGYATGDDKTKAILTQMQNSKAMYGEDALIASEILLKTAGNKVEIDVPGPKPEPKEVKKKDKDKKAK